MGPWDVKRFHPFLSIKAATLYTSNEPSLHITLTARTIDNNNDTVKSAIRYRVIIRVFRVIHAR